MVEVGTKSLKFLFPLWYHSLKFDFHIPGENELPSWLTDDENFQRLLSEADKLVNINILFCILKEYILHHFLKNISKYLMLNVSEY